VDRVQIGVEQDEKAHTLQGERTSNGVFNGLRWRHAVNGGGFGYTLNVEPDTAQVLHVSYWGSDGGNRVFDLLVDGETVGHQALQNDQPGAFFDVAYPLPEALLRGKEQVRVELRAQPGATAGGIFDLRVLRTEAP